MQELVTRFPTRKQLCQEDALGSLIHSNLLSRVPVSAPVQTLSANWLATQKETLRSFDLTNATHKVVSPNRRKEEERIK